MFLSQDLGRMRFYPTMLIKEMLLISFMPAWFIQGVLHPLQTPSHILLILALGLLVGQQQRQPSLVFNVFFFSVSVILGLIVNQTTQLDMKYEPILLVLCLITSFLVIIRLSLPNLVLVALMIVTGIFMGLDSNPVLIPGLGQSSVYSWIAGATCSFIGIILLTSIIAHFISNLWQGIIVRVIGSWIATSAIFVLTFILGTA